MEQIKKNDKYIPAISGVSINKIKTSLVFTLFAFLMGRLSLSTSISPFAQSFVLGSGNSFLVLAGGLAGILSNTGINTYKYALMLLFTSVLMKLLKLVFPGSDTDRFAPAVLFLSTFIFGMIFVLFTDHVLFDILLVILESFISGIFYYITLKFMWTSENKEKRFFSPAEFAAPLCILCVVISGIGNIVLPFGVSLKNIICIYLIFISSLYASAGTLAQISVFAGIAAGAGSDYFALFISYYTVNSLFCSVFAKYGRFASVLGFLSGNIALSILLSENIYTVIGFQDIAVSALLYIITSEKQIGKLKLLFLAQTKTADNSEAIKNIASVKLDRLSRAFLKLSESINAYSGKSEDDDPISAVCDSVADKVCKKCAMRFYCWQKDHKMTAQAFLSVVNSLKTGGAANEGVFPDYFKNKCIKTNEILNGIVSAYEILRLNTVWQNKMKENVKIYREQFYELSSIVRQLKSEIENNPCFDKYLSDEIASELEKEGFQIKKVSVMKDHNDCYRADIGLFTCGQSNIKCYDKISAVLEKVLSVPFSKSFGKCSFKECYLVFKESEIYSLDCAIRQSPKIKNEKCGDCWSVDLLENGNKYIALCDGSGSGKKANEYSDKTLKLLEEFLKTGFSKTSSLKLINSSFFANTEEDYFSTIDLGVIDLKSGNFEIVKKGAAPTYIMRSDGEYDVVKINTLPIGVFNGEKGKFKKTVLKSGDIIVMASDGICDALDREDWIIDALSAINSKDPEYIAEMIMKIASSSANAPDDDKTVIVAKLSLTDREIA